MSDGLAFNVGIPIGNFTVRDLAEATQRSVPGSDLRFTEKHGSDSRTYKVGFMRMRMRILSELKDYYQPKWSLEKGGNELVKFFRQFRLTEDQFRGTLQLFSSVERSTTKKLYR